MPPHYSSLFKYSLLYLKTPSPAGLRHCGACFYDPGSGNARIGGRRGWRENLVKQCWRVIKPGRAHLGEVFLGRFTADPSGFLVGNGGVDFLQRGNFSLVGLDLPPQVAGEMFVERIVAFTNMSQPLMNGIAQSG